MQKKKKKKKKNKQTNPDCDSAYGTAFSHKRNNGLLCGKGKGKGYLRNSKIKNRQREKQQLVCKSGDKIICNFHL